MRKTGAFWQFPVITERAFAEQHRGRPGFVAFPWATLIDRRLSSTSVLRAWRELGGDGEKAAAGAGGGGGAAGAGAGGGGGGTPAVRYTCCQHIHFRRLAELWHGLGIREVYVAHRAQGEARLRVPGKRGDAILLRPCALYAVNAEDEHRAATFRVLAPRAADPSPRPILFSFVGAYQSNNYLTDIRQRIFRAWGHLPKPQHLLGPDGCSGEAPSPLRGSELQLPQSGGAAKRPATLGAQTSFREGAEAEPCVWVESTGSQWHFQDTVYDKRRQNPSAARDTAREAEEADRYTRLLFLSSFSLCPSGSGPNSIRLWESLAAGAIPVVLSDRLVLPPLPGLEDVCLSFPERGANLADLETMLRNVPPREVAERRARCVRLYALVRKDLAGSGTSPAMAAAAELGSRAAAWQRRRRGGSQAAADPERREWLSEY